MSNAIDRAINYANSVEHEGAGYRLAVFTNDGARTEATVYIHSSFGRMLNTYEHGRQVFFDNVARVEVLWDS